MGNEYQPKGSMLSMVYERKTKILTLLLHEVCHPLPLFLKDKFIMQCGVGLKSDQCWHISAENVGKERKGRVFI